MVLAPGAEEGTFYRVTDDPTTSPPYKLETQLKQSTTPDFGGYRHVGYIDEEDVMKLEFSAHNVSLMPRGQGWAVAVLKDLEGKGLLLLGLRILGVSR